MADLNDLIPQIRAVVARYLDGGQTFDEAARTLAAILRPTIPEQRKAAAAWSQPNTGGRVRIIPLSASKWMNPGTHHGPFIEPVALAPGRSRADEHRAIIVMIEAARLAAREFDGDAA